mmetsp:Transcript_6525/g.17493  ORF Transcript_6525/g.17493 Transcript_6525/m.17493 type:complete len:208 (+) Transcript_6525:149-772(+)
MLLEDKKIQTPKQGLRDSNQHVCRCVATCYSAPLGNRQHKPMRCNERIGKVPFLEITNSRQKFVYKHHETSSSSAAGMSLLVATRARSTLCRSKPMPSSVSTASGEGSTTAAWGGGTTAAAGRAAAPRTTLEADLRLEEEPGWITCCTGEVKKGPRKRLHRRDTGPGIFKRLIPRTSNRYSRPANSPEAPSRTVGRPPDVSSCSPAM